MRMRKIKFIMLLGVFICFSCRTKQESHSEVQAIKDKKELLKQAQEEEFTE